MATTAIGINNRLSGYSIQQQQQQLMSGGASPKRNQLPSLPSAGTTSSSNAQTHATITVAGSPHIVHPISQPVSLAGSRITTSNSGSITTTAGAGNSYATVRAAKQRRPFSPVRALYDESLNSPPPLPSFPSCVALCVSLMSFHYLPIHIYRTNNFLGAHWRFVFLSSAFFSFSDPCRLFLQFLQTCLHS